MKASRRMHLCHWSTSFHPTLPILNIFTHKLFWRGKSTIGRKSVFWEVQWRLGSGDAYRFNRLEVYSHKPAHWRPSVYLNVVLQLTGGGSSNSAAHLATKEPFYDSTAYLQCRRELEKVFKTNACLIQTDQHAATDGCSFVSGKKTQRKAATAKKYIASMNLKVACWNVRTLLDNNSDKRPERRTALLASELKRYDIDIVGLPETRIANEGQITEVKAGYYLWETTMLELELITYGSAWGSKVLENKTVMDYILYNYATSSISFGNTVF